MYFNLPQLFVFLFDVLSVAVRVCHQGQICEKADLCLNLYPSVIKHYYVLCVCVCVSSSLCLSVTLKIPGTLSLVLTSDLVWLTGY